MCQQNYLFIFALRLKYAARRKVNILDDNRLDNHWPYFDSLGRNPWSGLTPGGSPEMSAGSGTLLWFCWMSRCRLSGFETATLMRKRPRSRCTLIIFMTAFQRVRCFDIQRLLSLRCGLPTKPVEPEVLSRLQHDFVNFLKENLQEVEVNKPRMWKQQALQLATVNAQPGKVKHDSRRLWAIRLLLPLPRLQCSDLTLCICQSASSKQEAGRVGNGFCAKSTPSSYVTVTRCYLKAARQQLRSRGKNSTSNGHPHHSFQINQQCQQHIGGVAVDITKRFPRQRRNQKEGRTIPTGVEGSLRHLYAGPSATLLVECRSRTN